jgi:hypothetical protein
MARFTQQQILRAVAETMEKMQTQTKAAGTTPSAFPGHGSGGAFSSPYSSPNIVNAGVFLPDDLEAALPQKRSVYQQGHFDVMTGQTATTGSHPTTDCGDGKQPGQLKLCKQSWPFGRLPMDSQVLNVEAIGLLRDRADFVDFNLVGNPFMQSTPVVPGAINWAEVFKNEKAKKLAELMFDFRREFACVDITGNPANTPGGKGYVEYYGLEKIFSTGYKDAITGVACPAADPRVISFASADIEANAGSFINIIMEAVNERRELAARLGLGRIEYKLIARRSLLRKLTQIWPCAYYTYRCNNIISTGSTNFLDAETQVRMRDEMRKGKYLLVDGDPIPYMESDCITETIPSNMVGQSDVFIVPWSSPAFGHNPGGAITYREFFDMTTSVEAVQGADIPYPVNTFQVLGGGQYLVYPKSPSNVCIQYAMLAKRRLICEAPFLGIRITNARYSWVVHENSPFPGDAYYHKDGGQYTQPSPYFYPPN